MAKWARVDAGAVAELYPRDMPVRIGGTLHSSQIFSLWSDAERAALGLYPVEMSPKRAGTFWVEDGIDYTFDGSRVVGARRWLPVDLEQAKAHVVANIKDIAGRIILGHVPDYKQRNLLAQGVMALTAYGADVTLWPESERATFAASQATWAFVQAVRVESNEREAEVSALPSVEAVEAYDWRSGWPTP
jgi:hypothetical protein